MPRVRTVASSVASLSKLERMSKWNRCCDRLLGSWIQMTALARQREHSAIQLTRRGLRIPTLELAACIGPRIVLVNDSGSES